MSKLPPCKDCSERCTACWDNCPKDARGEYGYKAWTEERLAIKRAEAEYNLRHTHTRAYRRRKLRNIRGGRPGTLRYFSS